MGSPFTVRPLRALLLAACLAGALALPAAASAMPADNGPAQRAAAPAPLDVPASPEVRTVIRDTGDDVATILAGAALLVAIASAGYSAVRLQPLRPGS